MYLFDSKNARIKIDDTPFAKGGEGAIYRIVQSKYVDCCVKVFHPGKIDSRIVKIDYMVKHQLSAPSNSQYRICWPIDFVYSNGKRVGFIMPLSFNKSHSLYDIYLNDNNQVFSRKERQGVENRLKLLYNIAVAINTLHSEGYTLVDFKPQNILFTDSGQISMIDLDSVQVVKDGSLLFPATAYTIEYAYPKELNGIGKNNIITTKWDCYSFAIVAYQILLGIHPFAASTNMIDRNGNEMFGLQALMVNNMFPFGMHKSDMAVIPAPHYYFFCLSQELQTCFVKSFDLNAAPVSMNDWLHILHETILKGGVEANDFKQKPIPPIVIITHKEALKENGEDKLLLKWKCFHCDYVKINNMDVTAVSEVKLSIPRSRKIIISMYNKVAGVKIRTLEFPLDSLYCIRCGHQFIETSDLFCNNCGKRRI